MLGLKRSSKTKIAANRDTSKPAAATFVAKSAHLQGPGQLRVQNTQLQFRTALRTTARLHATQLSEINLYGRVTLTEGALAVIGKHQIDVAMFSKCGTRARGRIIHNHDSATRLRESQYRIAFDHGKTLDLAKSWVGQKIESQIVAARYFQQHGQTKRTSRRKSIVHQLAQLKKQCVHANRIDVARGYEGAASAVWYGFLGNQFPSPFDFQKRTRRPPKDHANALLSLGYTLLSRRIESLLRSKGLEVTIGSLHAQRSGRASLACDLIEPLRIKLVDRFVLGMVNRKQVTGRDITVSKDGHRLTPDGYRLFLANWEQHYWSNYTAVSQTLGWYTSYLRGTGKTQAI